MFRVKGLGFKDKGPLRKLSEGPVGLQGQIEGT